MISFKVYAKCHLGQDFLPEQDCHPELVEGRLYFQKAWIRQAHHDSIVIQAECII